MKIFYRCAIIWAALLVLTVPTFVATLEAIDWITKLRARYIITYYETEGDLPFPSWADITATDAYRQASPERQDNAQKNYQHMVRDGSGQPLSLSLGLLTGIKQRSL